MERALGLTSSRSLSNPFMGWEGVRKSSLSSWREPLVKVRDSLELKVDIVWDGGTETDSRTGGRTTFD